MKRYKPKIALIILSVLLIVLTPIMSTVYAAFSYNGDKGGSDMRAGTGHEGASTRTNAFMMYFAYKDGGTPATYTMIVYSNHGLPIMDDIETNLKVKGVENSTYGPEFVFSPDSTRYFHDSIAPPPVSYNGGWVLQGHKVREYLTNVDDGLTAYVNSTYSSVILPSGTSMPNTPIPSGSPRYLPLLKMLCENQSSYSGDDTLWNEMYANIQDFSIVMQPVAWLHPYGPSTPDGLATADGWAKWLTDDGKGWYSHTFITGALQNCMVLEFARWGLSVPSNTSGVHNADYNAMHNVGYGIHIIDADGAPTPADQTTADEYSWYYGVYPHDPPYESYGEKTIIKNYRTIDDTTGVVTDDGVTWRNYVAETITVENELPAYKVVAWKTATEANYYIDSKIWESETDKPENVGTIKQQNNATNILGTVKLEDPEEKVLYVLLEKHVTAPPPPPVSAGDFIMSESTITRKIKLSYPDKNGMNLLKDKWFKWERPAHKYSCSHPHTDYDSCKNKDSDDDGIDDTCGGHSDTIYCSWGKFTDNKVKFSLKNSETLSTYADILATKAGWQAITTTGLDAYVKRYVEHTVSIYNNTSTFGIKDWDYACVLIRGKDKLTVAKWKTMNLTGISETALEDNLKDLSTSGFNVDNEGIDGKGTTGKRKTAAYNETFKFTAGDDSPDKKTIYSTTSGTSCGSNSYNCGENDKDYVLQDSFEVTPNVEVQTYSGSATAAENDTTCSGGSVSKAFTDITLPSGLSLSSLTNVRGVEVQSKELSFIPYIQMNYDTIDSTAAKHGSYSADRKVAYVLGDIKRSMTPNDYAEVSWKTRDWDNPNLTLESLQWSTHASVTDFIGGTETGKLGADPSKWTALPGGATLSLSIKKDDQQKVAVTTYQCIVEGTGEEQIKKAGGDYTGLELSDAETEHTNYVNTVVNALENTNVEQWVTWITKEGSTTPRVKGPSGPGSGKVLGTEDANVWKLGGAPISGGSDLSAATHSGKTASTESKYYLADDTSANAASEGDLDVDSKGPVIKRYTFYTNTYGDMYMLTDNVSGNETDEKVGTPINPSALTPNSIEDQINRRTHVIDKLAKAVEKKKGSDNSGRSKTGEQWYNEAFDGITVIVQSTELTVGFLTPPQRSVVLDPKLTQTQKNQRDMFNPERYNMSQYKTKKYSNTYPTEVDKLGEFKGTSVFTNDLQYLFYSKQFFIPNASVDDLH